MTTTAKPKDILNDVDFEPWIGKALLIETHSGIERRGICSGIRTSKIPYLGRSGPMEITQLVAIELNGSPFDGIDADTIARIEELRE